MRSSGGFGAGSGNSVWCRAGGPWNIHLRIDRIISWGDTRGNSRHCSTLQLGSDLLFIWVGRQAFGFGGILPGELDDEVGLRNGLRLVAPGVCARCRLLFFALLPLG